MKKAILVLFAFIAIYTQAQVYYPVASTLSNGNNAAAKITIDSGQLVRCVRYKGDWFMELFEVSAADPLILLLYNCTGFDTVSVKDSVYQYRYYYMTTTMYLNYGALIFGVDGRRFARIISDFDDKQQVSFKGQLPTMVVDPTCGSGFFPTALYLAQYVILPKATWPVPAIDTAGIIRFDDCLSALPLSADPSCSHAYNTGSGASFFKTRYFLKESDNLLSYPSSGGIEVWCRYLPIAETWKD